jgi:hypothetical protein
MFFSLCLHCFSLQGQVARLTMVGNHLSMLGLITMQIILAYVPFSTGSSLLSLRKSSTSTEMSMKNEDLAPALRRTFVPFHLPNRLEDLLKSTNLRLRGGAKSKNHTNHNQNAKAHRNGIKRVKT